METNNNVFLSNKFKEETIFFLSPKIEKADVKKKLVASAYYLLFN